MLLYGEAKTALKQFHSSDFNANHYKLEAAVRERKADLGWDQTLYEFIPIICFTLDPAGVVIDVNQFGSARLGYPAGQLILKSMAQILHPEDRQQLQALDTADWQHLDRVISWESRLVCADGQILWVKVSARMVPVSDDFNLQPSSVILLVCEDITQTKQIEQQQRECEKRRCRQTRALTELAKNQILNRGDLPAVLRKITKTVADTLEVERVSVWLYKANNSKIVCLDVYEAPDKHHSQGWVLESASCPTYFQGLEKQITIVINHTCSDSRTKEQSESYFSKLGITALLQVPIWLHGQIVGIICYEHITSDTSDKECEREWMPDEEYFAIASADFIALALEADTRLQAEAQRREREQSLLSQYYEQLEEAVEKRTAELTQLNEQLQAEIIKRSQTEATLRSQQQEQQIIFDSVPALIWYKDTNNRLLRINKTASVATGLPVEAIASASIYKISPNEAARYYQDDLEVINSGCPKRGIIEPLQTLTGEKLWIRTDKIPYRDSAGNIVGVIVFAVEITELIQAKEELRQYRDHLLEKVDEHTAELRRANEQLQEEIVCRILAEETLKRERNLFIGGPVTVFRWLAAENWPIEYVSPNISQFGYQASQCSNGQLLYASIVHPDDLERVLAEVQAYSEAGATSFEQDYRIVQKNGESRWVYDFTVVVRNETGKITYYEGYILDITQRKKIEAALRESEEQLRRFYEASFEAIAILEQERIVDVNKNFTELLGYESSEAIGMSVMEFVATALHPLVQEIIASGTEKTYESICVKKNGSAFPVEVRGKAITYQGRLVRVIAMRDLSERKQAEAELERSLSLLHATLESTADGIVALNMAGEIISFNRKFLQMWGIPDEFMASQNKTRLLTFAIEQLQDPEAFLQRIRELPTQVDAELYDILELKDGRIFERYSLPQRAGEKIIGRVWSFHDITERQRIQTSLLESERRFRAIFNSSFQFMGLMNPDGTLLEANQTALNFGGLTSTDVVARPFWECRWWVRDHQPTGEALERATAGDGNLNRTQERLKEAISQAAAGQVVRYEVEMLGAGDKVAIIDFSIKPVFNEAGEVVLLISEGHDITERKHSEIALRQQAERERLSGAITQRIRQSLDLEETLNTTVAEVRQLLQADRVIIFRFESNFDGVVAVESVIEGWPAILATNIHDPCFAPTYVKLYKQGRIRATENIYTANMSQCHVNLLAQFQVQANLVVPILLSEQTLQNPKSQTRNQLWGLLIAHQCSGPRQWQTWEGELLMQLTEQVAIAIQQAQLYQQLQAANRELERLASSDGLTLLANRRRFDTYLEQEVRRLAQKTAPISLIMCDIDCFKPYNDTYGHQAGDACLQQVARAIRNVLQRPADLAARYGGEEFAVILPDTDAAGAVQVAEAIRTGVRSLQIPHAKSGTASVVTLSLGVASASAHNTTPAQLIAAADEALYQAKEGGRDQVVVNS
jgi:diguanylate cyclase (GGDEF)-like protein/PAS domain S-box-containing protein